MRLLVFSDIHNNMDAVRALRQQEANEYDAVIVAGDIGSETAHQFFEVLDTFLCPVFYVYGNWDNELSYSSAHSTRCVRIHNNILPHGGYFFTGFSGCLTHWGKNPVYMEEKETTLKNHAPILATLTEAKTNATKLALSIEKKFKLQETDLLKHEIALSIKGHSKARVKLHQWRKVQLRQAWQPVSKLEASREHRIYIKDVDACYKRTLVLNRAALIHEIKTSCVAQDRLIVVTHERLFRFADEGVFPLLHVFGHRHEFKYTQHLGIHYLNAAALDTESFSGNPDMGGYCKVELVHGQVNVERRHIEASLIKT